MYARAQQVASRLLRLPHDARTIRAQERDLWLRKLRLLAFGRLETCDLLRARNARQHDYNALVTSTSHTDSESLDRSTTSLTCTHTRTLM